MKFRKIMAMGLAAAIVLGLTACSKKSDTNAGGKTILRIGVMSSIDIVPIVVADKNGYFAQQGISMELKTFKSAKDRDSALQAGEVDGVICDEVAVSIYQNAGIDMKITGTSTGMWTFVSGKQSGITAISDIKGKKIGISEHTMIEYLADSIVVENGIDVNDIEKVIIPAMPARLEALINNHIDCAILPAPFDGTAIADGGNVILKIYNKDIMISTIGFLEGYINKNPKIIKSFYQAYDKAVDELNSSEIHKYDDIIIETVGYPETMRENIQLPEFQHNYLPDVDKVQAVFDWSFKNGIIDKPLLASDIIVDKGIY